MFLCKSMDKFTLPIDNLKASFSLYPTYHLNFQATLLGNIEPTQIEDIRLTISKFNLCVILLYLFKFSTLNSIDF